jgi:DNA repair protein RecO (recombination protein O)
MEWTDEAIVLSVRPYSDHMLRVMLMTAHNGRHAGMVRLSRRQGGAWLPGTRVHARWRARLAEHLGSLTLESLAQDAALVFHRRAPFSALVSACELVAACVPEREPNPQIYSDLLTLIASIQTPEWPKFYALFELNLLQHLGFRLELSRCAATGTTENLRYISPRSGQVVSDLAGHPYADRLFKLPAFFIDVSAPASAEDLLEAMKITGYFLEKRVLSPLGCTLPSMRCRWVICKDDRTKRER